MIEWFHNFLSNPIYTFMAGFISGFFSNYIVGLYFHRKGIRKPGLTYKINEVRTQIVKSEETSKLKVLHNGREMVNDIIAVHIAIWNQGRERIRQSDMLRPLIIETENHAPILESNILKTKREVIEFMLDESKCEQGQLSISWDILETNDWGMIQIIYAGSPDLRITAHAIVEGQQRIINHSQFIPTKPGAEKAVYFFVCFMFFYAVYWLLELFRDYIEYSYAFTGGSHGMS